MDEFSGEPTAQIVLIAARLYNASAHTTSGGASFGLVSFSGTTRFLRFDKIFQIW